MRLAHADSTAMKGWYFGPWNSGLEVSIGYANQGIADPHYHQRMNEVYLVGSGTCEMRVGEQVLQLRQGDVVVVEPGEVHTFISSSPDYFHFVLHTPPLLGDEAVADRVPVEAEA